MGIKLQYYITIDETESYNDINITMHISSLHEEIHIMDNQYIH